MSAQDRRDPESFRSINQYIHDIWDDNAGLPQNTVRSIMQDRQGYLWFGTDEGIVRFNGTRFDVYDKLNVDELDSNAIRRIFEDSKGRLWIALNFKGLVIRENGRFRKFGTEQGFDDKYVTDVAESAGGIIWIATSESGLWFLDGDNLMQYTAANLASDRVLSVDVTRDGTVWIGTRDGLFRNSVGRIDRFSVADGLWSNEILSVEHDDKNVLWVGTRKGLNKISGSEVSRVSLEDVPQGIGILSIVTARDGNVWVGTDGYGLSRFDGETWTSINVRGGLSHDIINTIYEDREGSIWTGSDGGGLDRFRQGKITTYTTLEGLSHDFVLTVYVDDDGDRWFGTENGGVTRMTKDGIYYYSTRNGLSGDYATSIIKDDDGIVWIGTLDNGLNALLPNGRIVQYSKNDGLPGNGITSFAITRNKELLVGTDQGLARRVGNRFELMDLTGDDSNDNVLTILETRNGNLWVGTAENGVRRVSDFGVTTYTTADGLGDNTVLSLYEDASGTVWMGTYQGGLSRLRNNKITTYSTRNGLFNDVVYTILEDDERGLWMSCNKGLFRVAIDTFDDYDLGRIKEIRNTVYDINDGLRSHEFNGGVQPAGWKDAKGQFWFATVEGAAMVNPLKLPRNNTVPPVVIEAIRVEGTKVANADTLRKGTEKIEFDYAALTFINPEEVSYQYKLEGYDLDWTNAGPIRTATYTNMDPGEYTFRVRAANSDGVWNTEGASYSFYLQPFFYQTRGFWVLMALVLLVMAGFIYWLRFRALKARQRELERIVDERTRDLVRAKEQIEAQAESLKALDRFKTRFFNNISHEFRTPLTLTIGPLENALTGTYGPLGPAMRAQVEIMLRNSRRLLRLINQLLDLAKLESGKMNLKARNGNLVAFTEGIVYSFTAFASERGIDLKFESDMEDAEVLYDPEKIEKVLFNLLSNAVKFTSSGSIDVRLINHEEAGEIELAVADTGPGIHERDIPYLFDRYRQVDGTVSTIQDGTGIGLSLVKELVDLHDGRIEVESELGVGSVFRVFLKRGTDHLTEDQIAKEGDVESSRYSPLNSMAEMVVADPDEIIGQSRFVFDESKIKPDAPHVLVVDDNGDIRDYVKTCLYPNYWVHEAGNGTQAMDMLARLSPDLIISDIMMPHMDGYEFAHKVKTHPEYGHIPVIFLTAKASTDRKVEGLEMGADDYVSRPFNARELRARISNLIKLRRQERELVQLNETLEAKVESQLKLILEERHRYEDELIDARDKAEESARLKSAILDNISHEFRTPLTAILGYAQLLAREVSPEQSEFVSHIELGGKRLLNTLSAVIDLSRIESSDIVIDNQPTDIVPIIRETTGAFMAAAAEKHLELSTLFSDGRIIADVDPTLTGRIVANLVDNAIKFTDVGRVVVQAYLEDERLFIDVSDTGSGISESFRPHLFEAFKQESSGIARSHIGNGLGLAITKRLVELMGGVIDVESKLGAGSTFSVSFPLTAVENVPAVREPVKHARSHWVSPREDRARAADGPPSDREFK